MTNPLPKVLFLVCVLCAYKAHALQALPVAESLPYTKNANLGSAGGGDSVWSLGGSPGSGLTVSNTAALTYSGLATSSGSGVSLSGTSSRNRGIQFSPQGNADGTMVYCSFLLQVRATPSGNRLTACLHGSTSMTTGPALALFVNSSRRLGIARAASSPAALSSLDLGSNVTHLIVARYTFKIGSGNDQVDLWVDPASLGDNQNIPAFDASMTTGGSDASSLQSFFLNTPSSGGGAIWVDEVRIGTNWAQVTPTSGVPPVAGTPVIGQTLLTPAGLVLRGTGGAANSAFAVLAATNITQPQNQWTSIATNVFNGSGDFDCTNAIGSATRGFYRLQTDGGISVPPVSPTITTQPQSQSAVIGQTVAFSVFASGTDPLSYQWYFNTNTPLAGGTEAMLTLNSVQTSNAGSYFVIVTNNYGAKTSIVATLTVNTAPTNGAFYVAPTGDDSNPGTLAAPFFNLSKAISLALPGDTIYMRGGTYFYATTIVLEKSGTATDRIKIFAFPGELPFLDFTNQPYASNNRGLLLTTSGNYWHIKGLEIARAGDNGIKIEGSHNIVELCVFHHCGDTGLQIGFGHDDDNPGDLAAFNLITNCDSYLNFDFDNIGSDADGFACKLHPGMGNVFAGCRAWENADDGWDLFESDHTVILTNCWQWHSGDKTLFEAIYILKKGHAMSSFQGNGNGIKLGGNGAGGASQGVHKVYNCIAFNNNFPGRTAHGFDQNSHHGGVELYNCVSYGCNYNYFFEDASPMIFRNNVSFAPSGSGNGVSDFGSGTTEDHNSWDAIGVTANASDFNAISEAAAKAPRQANGSLPTGFMRLVAGSDLIDKGVNVGIPFTGTAPDLGAFESAP